MIFKVCFILSLLIFSGVTEFAQQTTPLIDLSLDREELSVPCRPGSKATKGQCSDQAIVKVETKLENQIFGKPKYSYEVSGGKIIGTGANVSWDLNPLQPGSYQISVSVEDDSGKVKGRATRMVSVKLCLDCTGDCFCFAQLGVTAGIKQVIEGKTVVFKATSNVDATYQWSVFGRKIIKGQGTRSITVRALSLKSYNNVGATVTSSFSSDLDCPYCSSRLEATAAVILEPAKKSRKR